VAGTWVALGYYG